MGMIAALKFGYKTLFLRYLLEIFDTQGGFEEDARRRACQQPVQKGIQYGGKPYVLYCIIILKEVWDGKFSVGSIQCCCSKSGIFPVTWNAYVNRNFTRESLS